jgi:plasmid stability protein
MIQIRNVPDALHRKLKARAAAAGMSLSDYLLGHVRQFAEAPTMEEMRARLASLKPISTGESTARMVRVERDSR